MNSELWGKAPEVASPMKPRSPQSSLNTIKWRPSKAPLSQSFWGSILQPVTGHYSRGAHLQ